MLWYSLEVPRRQHIFSWRNWKNILWIPPLIWRYVFIALVVILLISCLILLTPNFRRHLSSALFSFNKLSIVKKFICKVNLNVKQSRSWWDGSLWAVSSGPMLLAKLLLCLSLLPVAVKVNDIYCTLRSLFISCLKTVQPLWDILCGLKEQKF